MKFCATCGYENFSRDANCVKCGAALPPASEGAGNLGGAASFNGIGSTFYGERDYAPDGSYLTTEFVIFFYLPLFPTRSLRVLRAGEETSGTKTTTHYRVLSVHKPHAVQVLSVYSFALAMAAAGALALIGIARGWFPNVTAMVVGTIILLSTPYLCAALLQGRARSRTRLR